MLPSDVLSLSQLWKSWLLPRVKFKHLLHEKLFECGLTLYGWFERLNNFRFTCLLFVCSACSVSGPSLKIRSIRRQSTLLLPLPPKTRILPRKQLLLSDQFIWPCMPFPILHLISLRREKKAFFFFFQNRRVKLERRRKAVRRYYKI